MSAHTEQFTIPQKMAITASEPDVLVSAAAGSGKTHVLTKRVELLVRGVNLERFRETGIAVEEPELEKDIRRMLVVTFTRAAASEMRTRIVERLTRAAQESGDEEKGIRLYAQAEAAAGADITTFHGFCRKVIAEHYDDAGVASGFTILSESQTSYLKNACVREVFDEAYAQKDPGVARLLERFGKNGDDAALMRLVVDIHARMMGKVDWREWLRRSLKDPKKYAEELLAELDTFLIKYIEEAQQLQNTVVVQDGTSVLAGPKTLEADGQLQGDIDALMDTCLQKGALQALRLHSLPKFPRKPRGEELFEETREYREKAKKNLKYAYDIAETLEMDTIVSDLQHTQADIEVLVGLVEAFEEKYTERKLASNRLDFSDLEHRALQVLETKGEEYARHYEYIFVDEYQDTNPVQEAILEKIHPQIDGRSMNNEFLVGDMKQSIYGFRFADPTIFDGKSRSYESGGRNTLLIRMNDNFRSSNAVIDTVNALMHEVMNESLGDVSYTDKEKLEQGIKENPVEGTAGILLGVCAKGEEATRVEVEAGIIADRIEALHADGRDYGEIAILYRSRGAQGTALAKALEERGIPYAAEKGYGTIFIEIDIFLNLLKLVINDRQDIPLLSVLRSFLFNFDEPDFSCIVDWCEQNMQGAAKKKRPFFRQLHDFHVHGGKDPKQHNLHERVARFFKELDALRRVGTDMSLIRFAEEAADRFGFPAYLMTRPNGSARRKMFEALLDVLAELQDMHGNSLLRVIDAVEELKSRGELFRGGTGAPTVPGAVRIMTIHGSKGLEFPVVFLAGCGRTFNAKSREGSILRSDRFGVSAQYVDPENILRRDTLETTVVKEHLRAKELSEELRLLYVALTRAKYELYLCGTVEDMDKAMERWEAMEGRYERAPSMLDWIMGAWCALKRHGDPIAARLYRGPEESAGEHTDEKAAAFDWKSFVSQVEELKPSSKKLAGLLPRPRIAAQQNVSRLAEEEFEETAKRKKWRHLLEPVVDVEGELAGAERGTLYHHLMQYAVTHRMDAEQALTAMRANLLVSDTEEVQLHKDMPKLQKFFSGPLYARLRSANRVLVEQKFRLLVDPAEIGQQADPDTQGKVTLQGMIDLAFREGDEWVLIDYKSDREPDRKRLVDRYGQQVELYRRAIEAITRQKVKESCLYLFETGDTVEIPL